MILEEMRSKYSQSDFKDFDYNDVLEDFNSVDDSEKAKPEYLYEQLAFRLQPQYGNNPWGHYYYGPQITFRGAKGLPIYSPAIDEITPEVVEYWKKRLTNSNNPLLKLRYATLVWDFQPSICHQPNDGTLYRNIVDDSLEVCNGDFQVSDIDRECFGVFVCFCQ